MTACEKLKVNLCCFSLQSCLLRKVQGQGAILKSVEVICDKIQVWIRMEKGKTENVEKFKK